MPEREIMMEGQCLVLSLMLPVPILFMDVQSQYSRSLIRSTTSCGYDKSRRVVTAANLLFSPMVLAGCRLAN